MAVDETTLLNYEDHLIQFFRDDPRLLQSVVQGFTAEHFRNPKLAAAYRDLHARYKSGKLTLPTGELLRTTHVRSMTAGLRDAHGRPLFVARCQPSEPPQVAWEPQPHQEQPVSQPARRRFGKKFLELRRSARKGDLKVLVRYFERLTKIEDLEALFPGRDFFEPDEVHGVSAAEIGRAIKLSCSEMFDIEAQATENGRQLGWHRKRKGEREPYIFAFRTIGCFDVTAGEAKKLRKRHANKRASRHFRKGRMVCTGKPTCVCETSTKPQSRACKADSPPTCAVSTKP